MLRNALSESLQYATETGPCALSTAFFCIVLLVASLEHTALYSTEATKALSMSIVASIVIVVTVLAAPFLWRLILIIIRCIGASALVKAISSACGYAKSKQVPDQHYDHDDDDSLRKKELSPCFVRVRNLDLCMLVHLMFMIGFPTYFIITYWETFSANIRVFLMLPAMAATITIISKQRKEEERWESTFVNVTCRDNIFNLIYTILFWIPITVTHIRRLIAAGLEAGVLLLLFGIPMVIETFQFLPKILKQMRHCLREKTSTVDVESDPKCCQEGHEVFTISSENAETMELLEKRFDTEYKLLTWNLGSGNARYNRHRIPAALDKLGKMNADIIFLQEYSMKLKEDGLAGYSGVSFERSKGIFLVTMVKNDIFQIEDKHEDPVNFFCGVVARPCHASRKKQTWLLVNCHLKANASDKGNTEKFEKNRKTSFEAISAWISATNKKRNIGDATVIIGGDMNMLKDEKSAECLEVEGFRDSWSLQAEDRQQKYENTVDQNINKSNETSSKIYDKPLEDRPPQRFDRIYVQPEKFEVTRYRHFGKKPHNFKDKDVPPINYSDHFGVELTIHAFQQ